MTIKRTFGVYTVECDACGELCDEDGDTFQEAVDVFKAEGGRVRLDEDGEWCHYCAGCR